MNKMKNNKKLNLFENFDEEEFRDEEIQDEFQSDVEDVEIGDGHVEEIEEDTEPVVSQEILLGNWKSEIKTWEALKKQAKTAKDKDKSKTYDHVFYDKQIDMCRKTDPGDRRNYEESGAYTITKVESDGDYYGEVSG